MNLSTRARGLLEAAARKPSVFEHPGVRRIAILIAGAAFVGGLSLALAVRPGLLRSVDLSAWALVFACVPLTVLANACQFWLTGRLMRVSIGPLRAVLVTLLSTAANMLPLPGGSVVRVAALKNAENTYRQTTIVTVLTAGAWLGVTLTLAGLALLALDFAGLGASAVAGGMVALCCASAFLNRVTGASGAWMTALISVQMGIVAIGTLRLWLCFRALDEPVAALQALVLTLSTVTAGLVGVAPAGLGVTETAAAGIALAIGVPASAAFVAAALNRITGLLVVGPLAALFHRLESSAQPGLRHRSSHSS